MVESKLNLVDHLKVIAPLTYKSTDAGACHVFNGNSLHSTYAENTRANQLKQSLDPRTREVTPEMINGTGNIYQMTMWLDAGNNYRGSVNYFTKKKGEIVISINEWLSYYNVRINKLKFNAGTEVLIKVKPIKHTTSANFRELSIKKRQCRFEDENEVRTNIAHTNTKYINSSYFRITKPCSGFTGKRAASLSAGSDMQPALLTAYPGTIQFLRTLRELTFASQIAKA